MYCTNLKGACKIQCDKIATDKHTEESHRADRRTHKNEKKCDIHTQIQRKYFMFDSLTV